MNFFNGRKPREVGKLRTDYSPPDHMKTELTQLFQSVDDMTERMKIEEPPALKINNLDEIAHHLRRLTYGEMVELAEQLWCSQPMTEQGVLIQMTQENLPTTLHKWATDHRSE